MDLGGNGAVWLRLAEAAPELGLSLDGLRARVRRGQITSRRGNDGRLLVAVNGTVRESAREQGGDSASTVHESTHEQGQHSAADLLAACERAARAEGELVGLREALARADAALTRVEAALARADAALALERSRADRLAADLAHARKGWLERLLEAVRRR